MIEDIYNFFYNIGIAARMMFDVFIFLCKHWNAERYEIEFSYWDEED